VAEGLQLSVAGFPARFCVARTALGSVLTHTIGGTPGLTLVVQGVDASCSALGVAAEAWISMGSPGNKCFFMGRTWDGALDDECVWGSWRGALPIGGEDGCEFGIECAGLGDLAITAWGIWLPHSLSITL
jgi:hypothetical protein